MKYKILWQCSIPDLAIQVNAAIKEGWLPKGGIAIGELEGCKMTAYFQAMIIHEHVEYVSKPIKLPK